MFLLHTYGCLAQFLVAPIYYSMATPFKFIQKGSQYFTYEVQYYFCRRDY